MSCASVPENAAWTWHRFIGGPERAADAGRREEDPGLVGTSDLMPELMNERSDSQSSVSLPSGRRALKLPLKSWL